ncbi:hypothetical protein EV426DRAFT_610927 [Tirmania nivea]|nr:hypothetical protein EV426DRAFT_610927 [Tirmania nivea]
MHARFELTFSHEILAFHSSCLLLLCWRDRSAWKTSSTHFSHVFPLLFRGMNRSGKKNSPDKPKIQCISLPVPVEYIQSC